MRILLLDRTTSSLYRLLRVLDLKNVSFSGFPSFILQLIHLKYLSLNIKRVEMHILPIGSLWNLETFILRHGGETDLILQGIWIMAKLRHLYIYPSFKIEVPPNSLVLDDLQTMTTLKCPNRIQDVLARIPNLRKLGIYLNEKSSFSIPDFSARNTSRH
ncbi:hypothetical protein HAX54_024804 [Datura stramonium]|uniref:Disease resistance R13L4/SHOC-2-like LRR domain-containing protein n=1 Tax=Datura stramonium TaxID=4076 RepID=A0ABS8S5K4_DATST|nr:hypothetical protein [Datura stramonium]